MTREAIITKQAAEVLNAHVAEMNKVKDSAPNADEALAISAFMQANAVLSMLPMLIGAVEQVAINLAELTDAVKGKAETP